MPWGFIKDNIIDPIVEDVVEPVVENVIEPVVEDVIEPVVEPVIEVIREGIWEQFKDGVTTLLTGKDETRTDVEGERSDALRVEPAIQVLSWDAPLTHLRNDAALSPAVRALLEAASVPAAESETGASAEPQGSPAAASAPDEADQQSSAASDKASSGLSEGHGIAEGGCITPRDGFEQKPPAEPPSVPPDPSDFEEKECRSGEDAARGDAGSENSRAKGVQERDDDEERNEDEEDEPRAAARHAEDDEEREDEDDEEKREDNSDEAPEAKTREGQDKADGDEDWCGRSGDPRGAEQDAALFDPAAGGRDAEIDFAERVGAWVEARAREAGVEEVPDLVGFLSELAERMGAAELSEGGPGDAGDQGAALMAGPVAEHAGGPDLWFA